MQNKKYVLPYPHRKQKEVFISPARFKVLNWGRRCLAAGTKVLGEHGYIEIDKIKVGDRVYSVSSGGTLELKEVIDTRVYGVEYDPKPMIQFKYNDKTLKASYDHEIYYRGHSVHLFELAWGAMVASEREKLQLLCQQYGQATDNQLQGWVQNSGYETSQRQQRILENGDGRQNSKGSQGDSRDVATEPSTEATGESYKQRQIRQSSRESGMGNSQREHSSLRGSEPTIEELGREVRNSYIDGRSGEVFTRDKAKEPEIQQSIHTEALCTTGECRCSKGYIEWQDLEISQVEVLPAEVTYDITVEDNRNFLLEDGLLSHNSGKSMGIGEYVMLKAIEKQGNYYIIAPTYKQAKSIFWSDILKVLVPGAVINKTDENELYIELKPMRYKLKIASIWGKDIDVTHDEDKPPSRIYLKGADNPDSLRGVALDGAVLDEFAFVRSGQELWNKIIRPALADRVGWAVFSSTPNGRNNAFYDMVKTAQDPENQDVPKPENNGWFYSHATALDNPYFDKANTGEWEHSRRQHEKDGKMDEWLQEWEAQFSTPQKLIYRNFNPDIHVVHPRDVPEQGTDALAMDFGWNDPFAAVFVRIDFDGNWWVYDEIKKPELDTEKEVKALRSKMGDRRFARIIGDSNNKTEIANLRRHRIWVTPVRKLSGSVEGGLKMVRSLLEVRESTGKPKMYISAACRELIKEMEAYEYETDAFGGVLEYPKDKQEDHLMDALRYIVLEFDQASKPPPKAKKQYSSTGRLVS